MRKKSTVGHDRTSYLMLTHALVNTLAAETGQDVHSMSEDDRASLLRIEVKRPSSCSFRLVSRRRLHYQQQVRTAVEMHDLSRRKQHGAVRTFRRRSVDLQVRTAKRAFAFRREQSSR